MDEQNPYETPDKAEVLVRGSRSQPWGWISIAGIVLAAFAFSFHPGLVSGGQEWIAATRPRATFSEDGALASLSLSIFAFGRWLTRLIFRSLVNWRLAVTPASAGDFAQCYSAKPNAF